MPDSALHRFLGGSPGGVALRLLVLSLLVGALMSWLGIDPVDIGAWLRGLALHLYATGFEGLHQVGRYIALGAALVVPLWLVSRLLRVGAPPRAPAASPDRWRLRDDAGPAPRRD